jgi:hypothetical protein
MKKKGESIWQQIWENSFSCCFEWYEIEFIDCGLKSATSVSWNHANDKIIGCEK